MRIHCTHDEIACSQCHGCIENGDCEGAARINKLSSTKTTRRQRFPHRSTSALYHVTITLFLAIITTAQGATESASCPAICSCEVETLVYCNNKGLTRTPTDFTSSVEELYLFNNNISSILPATLTPLTVSMLLR